MVQGCLDTCTSSLIAERRQWGCGKPGVRLRCAWPARFKRDSKVTEELCVRMYRCEVTNFEWDKWRVPYVKYQNVTPRFVLLQGGNQVFSYDICCMWMKFWFRIPRYGKPVSCYFSSLLQTVLLQIFWSISAPLHSSAIAGDACCRLSCSWEGLRPLLS